MQLRKVKAKMQRFVPVRHDRVRGSGLRFLQLVCLPQTHSRALGTWSWVSGQV